MKRHIPRPRPGWGTLALRVLLLLVCLGDAGSGLLALLAPPPGSACTMSCSGTSRCCCAPRAKAKKPGASKRPAMAEWSGAYGSPSCTGGCTAPSAPRAMAQAGHAAHEKPQADATPPPSRQNFQRDRDARLVAIPRAPPASKAIDSPAPAARA